MMDMIPIPTRPLGLFSHRTTTLGVVAGPRTAWILGRLRENSTSIMPTKSGLSHISSRCPREYQTRSNLWPSTPVPKKNRPATYI